MRKWAAAILSGVMCVFMLMACSSGESFQDGVYRAEVSSYDSNGYKDFVELTVQDGVVTQLVYDGLNAEGQLKTADTALTEKMEPIQGTYPEKYSSDLVNQYITAQSIDEVDAVAGATNSTNNFMALLNALEPNMRAGDTTTLVIESVPEV